MKKSGLLLLLVALVMAIFFVGCKKQEKEATSAASPAKTAETTKPTVRLITDATGVDDKSFNAAAWRGILEFYDETWENQKSRGSLYDVVTCQTQDMYVPTLKQISEQGYDLVVVTGFTFADALNEVAPLYPDQNYVIVDVDYVFQPNVTCYIYAEEQGSYLVGVAAALQAQLDGIANPKFGFIGGIPGATITKFEVGYIQGVKSIIKDAQFVDYYANDWGKPELAKSQAKNWFDSGVYAIFSAAGGTGGGTIAQAKEYRMQGKNVWAIGVDSDQYEDGIYSGTKSAVLTSMVKRVETSMIISLMAVERKEFKSGVIKLDMASDGVDYAQSNPELSADVIAKIENLKKDIINGKITVVPTYKESVAAGLVPNNLGAKDD